MGIRIKKPAPNDVHYMVMTNGSIETRTLYMYCQGPWEFKPSDSKVGYVHIIGDTHFTFYVGKVTCRKCLALVKAKSDQIKNKTWRENMKPKNRKVQHPGHYFNEFFAKDIPLDKISEVTGIPYTTLVDLIESKIDIDPPMAKKLSVGLHTTEELWLRLQTNWNSQIENKS